VRFVLFDPRSHNAYKLSAEGLELTL